MTIRTAVTCDRTHCLAIYVEPQADPYALPGPHADTRGEDVLDVAQLAEIAGWLPVDQTGHVCPACAADRGPVYERGECLRCGGRTTDLPAGARCQYCHDTTPHPADDDQDDDLEAMHAAYEEIDATEMDARDAERAARQAEREARCPAAHPEDPTPCAGPLAVTVLDRQGGGADGCEHHGARLLASLDGARVYSLPEAGAAAVRVFKAAAALPPYAWRTEGDARA